MTEALTLKDWISGGGLAGFVIAAVWTYRLGWWCTGRELLMTTERALRAEADALEWKRVAMRGVGLAEKAATIAETAQFAPAAPRPPEAQPLPPH